MITEIIQVVTTTATQEEAQQIASELVSRRLAACVQVSGPITSTFRWLEEVDTATEWLCTIKTRLEHFTAIAATIRELHSYDVPEILAFPILMGETSYVEWLRRETSP